MAIVHAERTAKNTDTASSARLSHGPGCFCDDSRQPCAWAERCCCCVCGAPAQAPWLLCACCVGGAVAAADVTLLSASLLLRLLTLPPLLVLLQLLRVLSPLPLPLSPLPLLPSPTGAPPPLQLLLVVLLPPGEPDEEVEELCSMSRASATPLSNGGGGDGRPLDASPSEGTLLACSSGGGGSELAVPAEGTLKARPATAVAIGCCKSL